LSPSESIVCVCVHLLVLLTLLVNLSESLICLHSVWGLQMLTSGAVLTHVLHGL